MTRRILLYVLLLQPVVGGAEPIVRVSVEPERVRVGEAVELEVQVLVPTWFTQPTRYPAFELANAITRLPPDSTHPSSATVDGERWSGITRRYRVLPLLGARYEFDGLELGVSFFDPVQRGPRTTAVAVPAVGFLAEVPAGAEGLDPYLAGDELALRREIASPLEDLEVGDAIVLRYRAELDGLPPIFLPPLVDVEAQPGVSVYVDEVELGDDPVSFRSERATFVFDRPGSYRIPGSELLWWNVTAREIASSRVEPLEVVVGAAAGQPRAGASDDGRVLERLRNLLRPLLALGALVWLAWRFGPGIRRRLRSFTDRREASEARAFERLGAALASGDARAVHATLLVWVGRIGAPRDLRAFARSTGSETLASAVEALLAARFAVRPPTVDYRALRVSLVEVRAAHRGRAPSGDGLPALNPGG